MYETYYDKIQPYFRQENIQLHHIDTDAFVLSVNTNDIIRELKILEHKFHFSYIEKNQELFSNKNKKVIGKFKNKTRIKKWIDEFVCLKSKKYSFKCGDDN